MKLSDWQSTEISSKLLSPRFSSSSPAVWRKLTARQVEYLTVFCRLVESGDLQFTESTCPCEANASYQLIASRDRYGLPIQTVLCSNCGTTRANPYFTEASQDRFYRELYQELYGRSTNPVEYFERQRVYGQKIIQSLFSRSFPDGFAVLEVGCGAGGALFEFQMAGCLAMGCELSAELVDYAVSRGLKGVVFGGIETVQPPKSGFDFVYLHHVLEHVANPTEVLASCKEMMKPNGRILIVVPDLWRIDAHKKHPCDIMEFLHVAHKFNFSKKCFLSIADDLNLDYREACPNRTRTAWSDAPELWIELSLSENKVRKHSTTVDAANGRVALEYLRAVEMAFERDYATVSSNQTMPMRATA